MKGKKVGRVHLPCNFLCFSFSGDERMAILSFVLAVYGGKGKGASYKDRSGTAIGHVISCRCLQAAASRCHGPSGRM